MKAHQYTNGWENMAVIFQTNSWKIATDAERKLIEFADEESYANFEIWNEIGGGGGNKGDPPYFVYLLLE